MLRVLLSPICRSRPLSRPILRMFCQQKNTNPRRASMRQADARTKTISLSEQQLALLSTIEPYQRALHHLQREQLATTLSCLKAAEGEMLRSHEQRLNVRIFLMNRKSIVLKLMNSKELPSCLRELFFASVAFKGYMSPDNLKHLSNMMLAQLYFDYPAAVALLEHLSEDPDLPKFYLPTLRFYKSLVYGIREETAALALEAIAQIEPSQSVSVLLKNNLAWISLWANQSGRPNQLRESLDQSLSLLKQTLYEAEMNDVEQMEFTREAVQDSLIKYILEAPLKNRSKLKLDKIRLANRSSHVLCMNIGQMEMRLQRYEEASFWLQLAMHYAGQLNEFDRVVRAMMLTGNILDLGGFDQRAEGVYLDILFNSNQLPDHARRQALTSYASFLHKRARFYESVGYYEQLGPDLPRDRLQLRLSQLLVPHYDFSY